MYVFVYGTLKKGHGNNRLLCNSKFVTGGVVRGFELFYTGFPVANRRADTAITGEVWYIGDVNQDETAKTTLWSLDRLEGYRQESLDTSMYHRVRVVAFGDDDNKYDCHMYVGNSKFWSNFSGMHKCPYDETAGTFTWSRGY